ncbi:hypothetical protein UFOVP270_3 [uncultured Caudovirales phage]|uniref:Uncharacterized protein n=1 Tax=uncultured Caudovirales phage TaxID=2100421 RepID=A0A6J5LLN9_9CAUD|nr:hypothetical protein UFOVP101_53 [uncultured Caudovirales phage]CAB4133997.1 hypothetical protein UFOVP270_3 [uncultured Caudovirales phage]
MRDEIKRINLTLRMTEDLYNRAKRASFRDEIHVNEFIRQCVAKGTEDLIRKQERDGYSCQTI